MRHALSLILPAVVLLAAAAPPAAAGPRAQTAAQRHAAEALDEAAALRDGRGVRTGRELTLALRELAQSFRHLSGGDRAEAKALLARPTDAGDEDAYDLGAPVASQCSTHFCVHYVDDPLRDDAATAAFAADVLDEASAVRAFENGTLGWRVPPSDAPEGGDARTDIYLKELGADGLFGFAATDVGQLTQAQHSYLVLDNDYDPAEYGGVPARDSMRVTLAHEYGHVLQYGYDVLADGWHYESSATWLEGAVYPELNDWLRYVYDSPGSSGWRSLTELPLTAYTFDPSAGSPDPRNSKPYGTVVWNHYLTTRYGNDLQRRTWELSDGFQAPSTHAYDGAIRAGSGAGFASEFAAFSAAAAEWRAAGSPFQRSESLPDVERVGTLATDGAAVAPVMDHLTFGFYDVPATSAPRIRLAASFPRGMHGALALVARRGPIDGGQVTTALTELPDGGAGGVTLNGADGFAGGRITAVLINADAAQTGFDDFGAFDWLWSRDDQRVAAAISSDVSGPGISDRSPAPDATGVGLRSRVRVTFSEPVAGVDRNSFTLRAPGGRVVPASVSYAARSRTAVLVPDARLADTRRYTVRLTDAIMDASATPLAATRWSFTTARRVPRAGLRTAVRGGTVIARLRSRDGDRLRWRAKLVADGRRLAAKRGRLRPGAKRRVRLRTGHRGRARLVVVLRDPQRNRRRLAQAVRIPGRS